LSEKEPVVCPILLFAAIIIWTANPQLIHYLHIEAVVPLILGPLASFEFRLESCSLPPDSFGITV
jgi:hypothetical protein